METQEHGTETTEPTPKKLNISIPAAIVTGAVIIALALIVTMGPKKQEATAPQPGKVTSVPAEVAVIRDNDYVRGNAETAEVVVIEYADPDCYYCQQFHPTIKTVVEENTGKVAWVYRHFPLGIHPNAYNESLALQCVGEIGGDTAFWSYLDTVMDVTFTPNPTSSKALTSFATDLGIDAKVFETCLKNQNTAKVIDAQIIEAGDIGASGTPFTILVNKEGEQIVIPGAYPIDSVRQMIKDLME